MADRKPKDAAYIVVNPRGIPDGVPVISIDPETEENAPRTYFAGDAYDGSNAEDFRAEGLLKTQAEIDAEVVEVPGTVEEMAGLPTEGEQLGPEGMPPAVYAAPGDIGEPLEMPVGEEVS